MASPRVLGRRLRCNKDTFVDPSEREPEAPAPVVGEPIVFAQPAPDAVVEEASTSDGRVRCAKSQKKVGGRCKHMFVPNMTVHGKLQKWCSHCQKVQQKSVAKYRKTGKGKKCEWRLLGSDGTAYCVGQVKRFGKEPEATKNFEDALQKFKRGSLWKVNKVALAKQQPKYLGCSCKILIDMNTSTFAPVLQSTVKMQLMTQ